MSTSPSTSAMSTPALQSYAPPTHSGTTPQQPALTAEQLLAASSDPEPLRNLIVNYLPPLMDEVQLFQLFSQFGNIESVKIIYDKESGESRGYGFIKFEFFFSATYAISCLNRFEIAGKKLKVAYANVAAAKEAYAVMKEHHAANGFTAQQQTALQAMYYNQMVAEAAAAVEDPQPPVALDVDSSAVARSPGLQPL